MRRFIFLSILSTQLLLTFAGCNKSNDSSSSDDTDNNGDTESGIENQSTDSLNDTDSTLGDDSATTDDTGTETSIGYYPCESFVAGHTDFTGMELFDGFFGAVLDVQHALEYSQERTDDLVESMAGVYQIAQGTDSINQWLNAALGAMASDVAASVVEGSFKTTLTHGKCSGNKTTAEASRQQCETEVGCTVECAVEDTYLCEGQCLSGCADDCIDDQCSGGCSGWISLPPCDSVCDAAAICGDVAGAVGTTHFTCEQTTLTFAYDVAAALSAAEAQAFDERMTQLRPLFEAIYFESEKLYFLMDAPNGSGAPVIVRLGDLNQELGNGMINGLYSFDISTPQVMCTVSAFTDAANVLNAAATAVSDSYDTQMDAMVRLTALSY